MGEKKKLFCLALIVAFFVLPQVSFAFTYSGAWTLDDESSDIFLIELTSVTGTGSVFMYDIDDEGVTDNLKILQDGEFDTQSVFFEFQTDNNWHAGLTEVSLPLNLGATQDFGFYFFDDTKDPDIQNQTYKVTSLGGASFRLTDDVSSPNTGMTVVVNDVAIPIPPSAWLLGSCVIGMFAIGRRFRR